MTGVRDTRGPIAPASIPPRPQPFTVCTTCGCTPMDACLVDGVPCGWASANQCTRCSDAEEGRRS